MENVELRVKNEELRMRNVELIRIKIFKAIRG
jgi:hypothetical protein